MAKLYFKYGTMASGKSLDLLKICYNYEENNKIVLILTSSKDSRSTGTIKSRTGLEKEAISIDENQNVLFIINEMVNQGFKPDCILVDEVQFFSEKQIYEFADIVDELDIPVICFGLRSNFKMRKFNSSSILMSIADSIEEIKTICFECGKKKSIVNARFDNGNIIIDGEEIKIGGNESYKPLCRKCYKQKIKEL
jgi:thymidine kinase